MTLIIQEAACGKADWPLAERDRPWDSDAAHARILAWAGGDTPDWSKVKQVYFWCAPSADTWSDFKLPFCDVVDGKVLAVPRGIFGCAGAIQGARGTGVDIPASDVAAVKEKIASYYRRMAHEFDDKSVIAPWESQETSRPDTSNGTTTALAEAQPLAIETPAVSASQLTIRASIATITVCFIEDGARSLNGRIYPKETVDLLIERAQARLADPDGLNITCYINHASADADQTLLLIGKVTKIWREGSKGYATISIADTSAGRDSVALAYGGYMRTESLRASGVIQRTDPRYDLPIVVEAPGERAELDGIDLTSFPGLQSVARIKQLLLEQRASVAALDCFALDARLQIASSPTVEKGPSMTTKPKLSEAKAPFPHAEAHKMVHDHVARVLDEALMPIHGDGLAKKEGRSNISREAKLAKKHAAHLVMAHDIAARQSGMDCEGGYESALPLAGIPAEIPDDGDGDDDLDLFAALDTDEGRKPMTPDQAKALLEAAGYKIEAPKTKEELLQEQFEAKFAEQARRFEEMLNKFAPPAQQQSSAPPVPQRQTMVEGATDTRAAAPIYTHGSYLRQELHPSKWAQLADRSQPLPQGLNPLFALKEMAAFLSGEITENLSGRTLGVHRLPGM